MKVETDDIQTEGCWPIEGQPVDSSRLADCSKMRVMTLVDRNHENGVK